MNPARCKEAARPRRSGLVLLMVNSQGMVAHEARPYTDSEPSAPSFVPQRSILNFRFSPSPCVMLSTAAMRNQKKNWLLA